MSDGIFATLGAPNIAAGPGGPRYKPTPFDIGQELPAEPPPPDPKTEKFRAEDRKRQDGKLPPGMRDLQALSDAGFKWQEIDRYKAEQTQLLLGGGFTPAQINEYWGDDNPDISKLTRTVEAGIKSAKTASGWPEIFRAGLQASASSLPFGPPDIIPPEKQSLAEKIAYAAGIGVGDLPVVVGGFVGGFLAGTAATGGPANPLSPVAGVAAGGFASGALPEAIRSGLMDYYAHAGERAERWEDVWARVAGIVLNTGKAGAVGTVGGLAGGAVGAKVLGAPLSTMGLGSASLSSTAANIGAGAAAGTVAGAALEGRVPEADDFIVAATLAIGMGGAGHFVGQAGRFVPNRRAEQVAANSRDIYEKTGLLPFDQVRIASEDPAFAADMLAPRSADGSFVSRRALEYRVPEPEPHIPEGQIKPPTLAGVADILGKYAVGNARVGGLSGVEKVNPEFAGRIDQMVQAMPPEIRSRFAITSGFRSPERQRQVYAEQHPGQPVPQNSWHNHGMAVDIGNDPAVIAWINANGERFGLGFPLRHLPGEQNHLEPLQGGRRVADPASWARGTAHNHVGEIPGIEAPDAAAAPRPGWGPIPKSGDEVSPELLNVFHTLESSGHDAVSPAGARGRGQIMPDTARQYGFDPDRLFEPGYNETVTRHVIADLAQKFNGDLEAMLVAYNAGPGRARAWLAGGRQKADLPRETQKYLERAEQYGFLDRGYLTERYDRQLRAQGDDGSWVPPARADVPEPLPDEAPGGGRGLGPPEPPEPPVPRTAGGPDKPPRRNPYADLDDETVLGNIFRHMVAEPEERSAMTRVRERLANTYHDFESQLAAARRWDAEHKIGPGQLGAEDMLRQTFASRERYGHFVRWGPVDALTLQHKLGADGKKIDASIVKAFQQVKEAGGNIEGFFGYLMGHRNQELRARGIESGGVPDMDAEAFRSTMDAKYEPAAKTFNETSYHVVDYGTDSGLFSRSGGEAMKRLNRWHLHYRRVMDPGYEEPSRKLGPGFAVRRATREIRGSARQIVDPLVAKIENDQTIIAMADRNRAIGSIINMERGLPPEGRWLVKRSDFAPTRDKSGRILDADGKPVADQWTGPDGKKTDFSKMSPGERAALETYEIYRSSRHSLGKGDFLYFNEGRPEIWHSADPQMAELLTVASRMPDNIFTWALGSIARLQRAGITLPLDFPVRSLSYGAMSTAAFVSEASKVPFRETLRGLPHVWNESEFFRDLTAAGGLGAAMSDLDANYLAKDLGAITRGVPLSSRAGAVSGVWNVFRHPIEGVRALQHMVDAAGRVGFALGRVEAGDDIVKAAMKGRTAYLDWAEGRAASWLRTWASYTPFMESAFKDMGQAAAGMNLRETATKPSASALRKTGVAAAWASVVLTTPSVLFWGLNYLADLALEPGEQWQEIPQDERDRFWVTPPIMGVRMRFPKPPGPALMFTSFPERLLNWLAGEGQLTEGMVQTMINQIMFPFVPALVTPVAEVATDHIFYRNTPLAPANTEGLSAYNKFTPYTTETAKKIAEILGPEGIGLASGSQSTFNRLPFVNPIATERFVQGWAGTLPLTALKVAEMPIAERARPWEAADIPMLGYFFRKSFGSRESIERFYKDADEFEATARDWSKAQGTDDIEGFSEHRVPIAEAASAVRDIKEALKEARNGITAINKDPEMENYEKAQQIRQILNDMVAVSRDGLEMMKEIREDIAEARREGVFQ